MTVNEYFDKVVFTNLPTRVDRLNDFTFQINKLGIKAERFEDIVVGNPYKIPIKIGNNGHPILNEGVVGGLQTLRNITKTARDEGWKNFLMFEDDAVFVPNFTNDFSIVIQEVPEDWCLLYLGGWNVRQPIPIVGRRHVKRVTQTYCAHAVAIKETVYSKLIEEIETWNNPGDVALSILQLEYPSYILSPKLVNQKPGWSDIWGKSVNYGTLLGDEN